MSYLCCCFNALGSLVLSKQQILSRSIRSYFGCEHPLRAAVGTGKEPPQGMFQSWKYQHQKVAVPGKERGEGGRERESKREGERKEYESV